MPRICTSANDPIDFCRRCVPTEAVARAKYGNVGDGPDGRGNCFEYATKHPDYESWTYDCATCKRPLTDKDY